MTSLRTEGWIVAKPGLGLVCVDGFIYTYYLLDIEKVIFISDVRAVHFHRFCFLFVRPSATGHQQQHNHSPLRE